MESLLLRIPEEQKHMLSLLANKMGVSSSELIRKAIEEYLVHYRYKPMSFEEALKVSAGVWKDRKDIGDSVSYVRRLRRESTRSLERRLKRFSR